MNFSNYLKNNRRYLSEESLNGPAFKYPIGRMKFDVEPLSSFNNKGYILTHKKPYISVSISRAWDKPIVKVPNFEEWLASALFDDFCEYMRNYVVNGEYRIDSMINDIDRYAPEEIRTTQPRVAFRPEKK
jgi:hypothetical protein